MMRAALMNRFAPPEWACFFEVANATGWAKNRSADAIAMNLYPSRGLELHGVEIKTHRSDWLRELKDPDKSAPVQARCNRWWIAISDPKIVKPDELPPTWGLLVLRGDRLVQTVPAPELAAPPLDKPFVAALLRSATKDVVPKSEVARLVAERVDAHHESYQDTEKRVAAGFAKQIETLTKTIIDFEAASGINIRGPWNHGEKIGAAVRLVLDDVEGNGAVRRISDRLEVEARALRKALENIEAARKELDGGR